MLVVNQVEKKEVGAKEYLFLHFSQNKRGFFFRERGYLHIGNDEVKIRTNRRKYVGQINDLKELVIQKTEDGNELHIVRFGDPHKEILVVNIPSKTDAETINNFLNRNGYIRSGLQNKI